MVYLALAFLGVGMVAGYIGDAVTAGVSTLVSLWFIFR